MSQRNSEYARKPNDLYETPAWVTEALLEHLPRIAGLVWEPAAGNGAMARVLGKHFKIIASDIELSPQGKPDHTDKCVRVAGVGEIWKHDFFSNNHITSADAIITNPPYGQSQEFVERALGLMHGCRGIVATLHRVDWDSAKTRRHLFNDHPAFHKKVVLTQRIAWFVEANGKPKASPSENHAWYLWDWRHKGPATIAYGPQDTML